MKGFILSPAAQADIDGIWDYTARRWGEEQAVRYLQDMRDVCRKLAAGTRPSRPVDIRPGYHRCQSGSHVLYFKTADDGQIVIIRILHQRMDVNRHL
jgi:toxin ParE1/3/4